MFCFGRNVWVGMAAASTATIAARGTSRRTRPVDCWYVPASADGRKFTRSLARKKKKNWTSGMSAMRRVVGGFADHDDDPRINDVEETAVLTVKPSPSIATKP